MYINEWLNNKSKFGQNNKKHKEECEMDNKNQKINCTVSSCKYNNNQMQKCQLESIIVTPVEGVNTANSDESMCSSYDNEE